MLCSPRRGAPAGRRPRPRRAWPRPGWSCHRGCARVARRCESSQGRLWPSLLPFKRECKGQGGGLVDRREWDDLDRLSRAHLTCPLRDDDEAIGIGHREKHVRALVAGQPDTDPVAITAGDAAEVLLEVRRVLQGVVRGGGQSLPLEIGATLHLQDRGADEQLDADEGRDGVAGQSDEWPPIETPPVLTIRSVRTAAWSRVTRSSRTSRATPASTTSAPASSRAARSV